MATMGEAHSCTGRTFGTMELSNTQNGLLGSDLPVIEVVRLWAGHPLAGAAEGFLFWKPWRGEAGIGDDG